jgi:hypothetical protein
LKEELVTSLYFKREYKSDALAGLSEPKEELEEDSETSESNSEADPEEAPSDLPEARHHDSVSEKKKYFVTNINLHYIQVVTNR